MDFSNFSSRLHPNGAAGFEGMVFTKNTVKKTNITVGDSIRTTTPPMPKKP